MLRHRVPGLRPTAVLLCCALASASTAALAGPEPTEADDPLAGAQTLYDKGRAKFETADYPAAIELWTEAYAQVPDTAEGGQIKVLLIYNIATAREKAFELTRDPVQLRQARILLEDFERSIPALYGEGQEAEAERARVREKLAAVEAQLEEIEREQQARDDHPQMPGDGVEPGTDPASSSDPATDEPASDPAAKGLVIAGAATLGLGVAGLGMMGAGLAIGDEANDISDLDPTDVDARRERFDRGRTGNTLAIAGGAVGGALVITGAVLLALGLKRKKASAVALVPSMGPRGASLALRARF